MLCYVNPVILVKKSFISITIKLELIFLVNQILMSTATKLEVIFLVN